MIINYIKGNKGKNDRIITITSDKKEWFSIFKLALLTNQLAINELNINKEAIDITGNFYFQDAMSTAIDMARDGIDWGLEENKDQVIKWCKNYKLSFETIELELRRSWQEKLKDFGDNNETI
jgi:hypothetical protein